MANKQRQLASVGVNLNFYILNNLRTFLQLQYHRASAILFLTTLALQNHSNLRSFYNKFILEIKNIFIQLLVFLPIQAPTSCLRAPTSFKIIVSRSLLMTFDKWPPIASHSDRPSPHFFGPSSFFRQYLSSYAEKP